MRTGDLYDRPGTFPGSTGAMAPLQPTEAWPRVSALCLSWRWHGIAAAGAAPKWQDRFPRVSKEINCSAIRKNRTDEACEKIHSESTQNIPGIKTVHADKILQNLKLLK